MPHIFKAAQLAFKQAHPILQEQLSVTGPSYALSLLTTSKNLREKASMESVRDLRQAAFMSILEDCQDASIASKDDLVRTCYLLEAWGQDEDDDSGMGHE